MPTQLLTGAAVVNRLNIGPIAQPRIRYAIFASAHDRAVPPTTAFVQASSTPRIARLSPALLGCPHRGSAGRSSRARSGPHACPRRHRPVSRELIERYFKDWAKQCGVTIDDLMDLGHRLGDPPEERFNMAVMGLRLAGRSNAVSKLHGSVSRDMFADL